MGRFFGAATIYLTKVVFLGIVVDVGIFGLQDAMIESNRRKMKWHS